MNISGQQWVGSEKIFSDPTFQVIPDQDQDPTYKVIPDPIPDPDKYQTFSVSSMKKKNLQIILKCLTMGLQYCVTNSKVLIIY